MLKVEIAMHKYFEELDALSEDCPMTKDGNDRFEKGVEDLKIKYEKLYPAFFESDAGVNMIDPITFSRRRKSSKFNVGDYVYFEDFWKWDSSGNHTSINWIYGIFLGKIEELPEEDWGDITYCVKSLYATENICKFVQACDMRKLTKAEIKALS